MTGIETIQIEGWGSEAEIRGLQVDATYGPGVFEAAGLAASTLSILAAAGALVLGLGLAVMGCEGLPGVCYGAAILALLAAAATWWEALEGLRGQGARHIDLGSGWVEIDHQLRCLRDATLEVETFRLLTGPPLVRISLAFPDETVFPLAQGRRTQVAHLVHALQHAPCLARRASSRPARKAA